MGLKVILYIVMLPLVIYSMGSINYEKFIKANKVIQARLLFLFIGLGLTYLSVNFMYDLFINTQIY